MRKMSPCGRQTGGSIHTPRAISTGTYPSSTTLLPGIKTSRSSFSADPSYVSTKAGSSIGAGVMPELGGSYTPRGVREEQSSSSRHASLGMRVVVRRARRRGESRRPIRIIRSVVACTHTDHIPRLFSSETDFSDPPCPGSSDGACRRREGTRLEPCRALIYRLSGLCIQMMQHAPYLSQRFW